MAKRSTAAVTGKRQIRAGQRVAVQFPGGPMLAEVIEDRGNVGWRGRHLVLVRLLSEFEEAREIFEAPLDELTFLEG